MPITLNANEIYNTLSNMIISQETFADNIGKHQTLVDKARVDGGLFGDTKQYIATDVLKVHDWLNDDEAEDLLKLERPDDPEVQLITIDKFYQIRCTLDNYMSKRAFGSEGAFAEFNSVMLGWLNETKRVFDGTTYNTYIGTKDVSAQTRVINIETALPNLSDIEKAEWRGLQIGKALADLAVEMGDYSRDFNEYGFLRSYADEDIKVIWNAKYINEIRHVDLPTVFHKDGVVSKIDSEVLPDKYFGSIIPDEHTTARGERTLVAKIIDGKQYFPGDVLPAGTSVGANETYHKGDAPVICKVLVKLPPYMSSFEVGSAFYNPRSLTETHFTTFGRNTLQNFKAYPFVTLVEQQ